MTKPKQLTDKKYENGEIIPQIIPEEIRISYRLAIMTRVWFVFRITTEYFLTWIDSTLGSWLHGFFFLYRLMQIWLGRSMHLTLI